MAEFYQVGIRLLMTSNHTQVISLLGRDILGVHSKVEQLTGAFNKLKWTIGGVVGIFAGREILSGLTSIIERTKDLSREMALLQSGGTPQNVIDRAYQQSIDLAARIPGLTRIQPMSIFRETRGMLGNEEALKTMGPLSEWALAMTRLRGRGTTDDETRGILRAAEGIGRLNTRGQYDEAKFTHFLDLTTKVTGVMGGGANTGTEMWEALRKRAGPAMSTMSDEGLMTMAVLAQAMGPYQAGTATQSIYQQLLGGQQWRRNAQELERIGVLTPADLTGGGAVASHHHLHARFGTHLGRGGGGSEGGRMNILTPQGQARLEALLSDDPLKMAANLMPYFQRAGITEPTEQIKEVFKIMGRSTSQREVSELLLNYGQFLREEKMFPGAYGVQGVNKIFMEKDVATNLDALNKAWTEFLISLAGPSFNNVIGGLKLITGGLKHLTDVVGHINPEIIKNLGLGLGVLAGTLTAGSMVAVIAALGPLGWLAAGLTALALSAVAWPDTIGVALQGFLTVLKGLAGMPLRGMVDLLGLVVGGLNKLSSSIGTLWDVLRGHPGGAAPPGGEMPKGDFGVPFVPPSGASYEGGGYLWQAAYHPGGGYNVRKGTGYSSAITGGALTGPLLPHGVSRGALEVDRGGSIGSVEGVRGSGTSALPLATPGTGGQAYLAGLRAPFAKELAEHPETMRLLGALIHAENPGAGSGVAESLMNRTMMVNQDRARRGLPPLTLRDMILGHPSIAHGKSFYGPIRHNALGGHFRYAEAMYGRIRAALAGSDVIRGHTDQGSRGDPNYYAGGVGVNIHGERFNDWGGYHGRRFREDLERHIAEANKRGLQSHNLPTEVHNALRRHFGIRHHDWGEKAAVPYLGTTHAVGDDPLSVGLMSLHHKQLRDHFGHRGRHDPEHPSGAIPHPKSHESETQLHVNLDGERVGGGVLRHIARGIGTGPRRGGKTADFASTRPLPV